MNLSKNIYCFNIKKEIKNIYKDLIYECITFRPKKIDINYGLNFEINSKYVQYLYNILLKICEKNLEKFTIKDNNFKLWCYYTDDKFNETRWHAHTKTATINSVLYLTVPNNNKGIDFKIKNNIINLRPKKFDLLIFPSYLEHYPHSSTTSEPRISLNLELMCKEKSKDIFKLT
jgi:hypothetical protein